MSAAKAAVESASAVKTVHGLLRAAVERNGAATALVAADGALLQYDALLARVDSLARRLRSAGVGRGDRVAIVLPNGTAMAIAVLAAACAGTACPLNPAYRSSELDFYFGDLQARALVTLDGCEGPATGLARARGMAIVDACAAPDAASAPHVCATSADTALILHTSGTTSRPKMVPLSHANLCSSAASIAEWLALSPGDRCLNVMPLFHIHGLVGALLGSLAAGASVVCTRGFDSTEFFTQLRELGATWYTAVPTMHQAILARAASEAPPAALRFVRSSSSALSPQTARDLERLFRAPVVEAYGMTEAAHQVCSTPLTPHAQQYGSVGLPVDCDVVVVDERGEPLTRGRTGEVTIRGANVMSGYGSDAGADRAAFAGGRLRTGDLGRFDDHGYLHLEGRIKDIINRGGEKVSPREIDEALLEHPAVAQAVAFAVPDERLGEEVAAAVVLHPNARADERALQHFVGARLADFKSRAASLSSKRLRPDRPESCDAETSLRRSNSSETRTQKTTGSKLRGQRAARLRRRSHGYGARC